MGNGHVPPKELNDSQYQTIKDGTVVTSGTYQGCVLVSSTYYWVIGNGSVWDLKTGVPDRGFSKITANVWDLCKNGGTYDWDAQNNNWEEPEEGQAYRWGAGGDGNVVMVEV